MKFNISASSLNVYLQSQVHFYYNYILKPEPDTEIPTVYGESGSLVHEILEEYIKGKYESKIDVLEDFEKRWVEQDLSKKKGFAGRNIKYETYLNALNRGISLLETKYNAIKTEEEIIIPLLNNTNHEINLKGYIDVVLKEGDDIILLDWKTSSRVYESDMKKFRNQGLMYCYLYFLKYKVLPKKVYFEYLKLRRNPVTFEFTMDDLKSFSKLLDKTLNDIISKGTDINNYDLGDFDNPFNEHLKKCKQIMEIRNGKKVFCTIKDNKIMWPIGSIPKNLEKFIDLKYSYYVDGYFFSEKYKKRLWDGKKHLLKKYQGNYVLPLAFINDFKDIVNFYNGKKNQKVDLEFFDERNDDIIEKDYEIEFKPKNYELKYYQKDAVNEARKKFFGILNLGTGAGKTYIAADLIRKTKQLTLFIVDRIELLNQTKDKFEDLLGIDMGIISEGKMDIKSINISSIQTILAILKRNNEESKRLRILLHNTQMCLFDECQKLSDSKMYSELNKYLRNLKYSIGLTGTPWRNLGDTLEMNSLVGFPIYTKTTQELEQEGYLCPTKCFFVHHSLLHDGSEDYAALYKQCISENTRRNEKIRDIAEKLKGKKILIVTKLVKHAENLSEMIPDSKMIVGRTKSKERKDEFADFKNNGGILVGSIKIFSAGIDVPDLDIIINASAHKSTVDSIQLIGRAKRKSSKKEFGYYIDFDDSTTFFKKSAEARKKILRKHGNEIVLEDSTIENMIKFINPPKDI